MNVNKLNLQKALELVRPGLATKEMINQSTYYIFKDGKVYTYNDEISVCTALPEIDFEVAVPANELFSYINKVTVEEVDVTLAEGELKIRAGRSKVGIAIQSEITLPIQEVSDPAKWKRLPEDFCEALLLCQSATSKDMSRPIITCVHIQDNYIEGTDSHRVLRYTFENSIGVDEVLIPANSVNAIYKLNPTHISVNGSWVHFKEDTTILSCRVFHEKFVNCTPLLQFSGNEITFPDNMMNIVERAGIFAKRAVEQDESISIEITSGRATITARSVNGSWFNEVIKVSYKGEDCTILVTPAMIREIFPHCKTALLGNNRLQFTHEKWKYLTMLRG